MKNLESNWQQKLQETFISGLKKAGIESGNRYLVGVSGGRDSVFLLHFLRQCGSNYCIAHMNHAARADANRDQQFVRSLASEYGVDYFTETIDVPAFAIREKLSFEEAARIVRYRYLMDIADEEKCAGVIVGHHADDQVETVLMHFLRGSGISGLAGMSYSEVNPVFSSTIPILRPMLSIWRKEIEQFFSTANLTYVEDETNSDVEVYRNRLRHLLIPELESYNAGIRQHVWQTSMLAQQAESIVNIRLGEAWSEVVVSDTNNLIVCNHTRFLSLAVGLQQAMIREILGMLLPNLRDFGYDLTINTQKSIEQPPRGGQWQITGNIFGVVHKEQLIIGEITIIEEYQKSHFPQWDQDPMVIIQVENQDFFVGHGQTIVIEECARADIDGEPWKACGKNEAWLDAASIEKPMVIRHFTSGDWFSPLGMSGKHRKLSDYFIDRKISLHARQNFPVICDRQGILWVVGEQIDDRCKISNQTDQIIRFRLILKETN